MHRHCQTFYKDQNLKVQIFIGMVHPEGHGSCWHFLPLFNKDLMKKRKCLWFVIKAFDRGCVVKPAYSETL